MKRFRFTLQALLTLRQREEHQAQERYAAALHRRRQAAEAMSVIEEEMVNAGGLLHKRLAHGSTAADLAQLQAHYHSLERRQQQAAETLKAAEQAIRPAHQEMLESRRQREVVEGCRDKQRQRHERGVAQAEAKVQDELALRRFAPAMVGHGND